MSLHKKSALTKRLDDLIKRKATGTLRELASKFNVSISTMQRYLDEFKEEFAAPVAFDRVHSTYYYTEPFELILTIEVHVNGEQKKII